MPIGPELLLGMVHDPQIRLVENLDDRELEQPEGAGFDLRVGEIFEIDYLGEAFLGVKDRKTPKVNTLARYGQETEFTLNPESYVLVRTIESVNLPKNIAGYTFPRSTLFRCGLQLLCTQIAPEYQGQLTFGLRNLGPVPVTIELGARIVHVQFEEVVGGGSSYRGQWQGGRVSTQGESEIQV